MKKTRKTRIRCSTDGLFHQIELQSDGTVLDSGTDITQEVERLAGLLRLGRAPNEPRSCVCFAALVLQGCEIILNREADEEGYIHDLGGWREIYVRFETNALVEDAMVRARARRRERTSSNGRRARAAA
jgi:hypothetical protein